MKDLKQTREWFTLAAKLLSPTELKVFCNWYVDAPHFSAGASLMHQRLPFIARQNVDRAMKGLEKKGFILRTEDKVRSNHGGKPTPFFKLNPTLIKDPQCISGDALNADAQNSQCINPTFPMHQSGGSQCITTDAGIGKVEERKKELSTFSQLHRGNGEEEAIPSIPQDVPSAENDIAAVIDQTDRLSTLIHLYEQGQLNLTPWELDNYPKWIEGLRKYSKRPLLPGKLRNLVIKEKSVKAQLDRYNGERWFKDITSWIKGSSNNEDAQIDAIRRYTELYGKDRLSKALIHAKAETAQELISSALIAPASTPPNPIKPILEANNVEISSAEPKDGIMSRLQAFDDKFPTIWRFPKEYHSEFKKLKRAINDASGSEEVDPLLNKFNALYETAKNQ